MKLGSKLKKKDGLSKWERYRLKDVDAYRRKKAEYARTPEERAKRTAYMREWREKNREHHNALCRASHQRNKHKHVERNREWNLRVKYGIGLAEYRAMFVAQDGRCALCRRAYAKKNLPVDHDHVTGKVRKLLCHRCNSQLGWFEKFRKQIIEYVDTKW